MTLQESQLLQDFLDQLVQIRGVRKDPEAQAMIQKALAQQPGAPYLLVQRAMLLAQALNQAKGQIAQLEGQSGNLSSGGNAWNQTPQEPSRNAPPSGTAPPAPQPRSGFLSGGAAAFWAARPQQLPASLAARFCSRDWKIFSVITVAVSLDKTRRAR